MSGLSLDNLSAHEGAADPHPGYQRESERGQPNGYAGLDGGGRVPSGQLPAATASAAGLVALDSLFGNLGPDLFGTGADGNATITSNTSLTRDMDYENLTVNNGVTLNTAGFRVRVASTLTWNGTIACNGAAPVGATGGVGGGSTAASYANGSNGAAGSAAAGTAAAAVSNNWGALHAGANNACRGGNGGVGGSGGAVAGGAGGTTSAPAAANGAETQFTWDTGYLHGQNVVRLLAGAGGGSGGGSGGTSGAGGGGGGICGVFARRIAGSGGAHEARGGVGGNAAGGNSGGGGGGGGGIVICRYAELAAGAALPTVSVAGGAGGTKLGTGSANGNSGQSGYSSVRRVVRVT